MTEARSDVVIRTPDQRLRVLVSSTLGELADERQAVSGAISTLRLTPVMFELGARPRFAALAFAEGNHERAALLEGAAEGLRQRAGVRAWPVLRRPETELAEEVREALGADRFDQVFARGSHLSSRTRWLPSATGQAPVRGRPELWPCPARRCQGASPIRRRTGISVRAAAGVSIGGSRPTTGETGSSLRIQAGCRIPMLPTSSPTRPLRPRSSRP
jgi:hypothetical protein